ncbi:hypothetical protein [Crenalkalicoccus roseus]|uniref:hypothetical protein n=1 Tax=Crenalkalicoccus roseus TaxID=1485588 RepID=UPI00108047D8|nr:hypothetical protein [Crenalkalicoccus roseus]
MPFTLTLAGGVRSDAVRRLKDDLLRAQKAAVAGATEYAKQRMREEIRARTVSTRLPNIIGSEVFPRGAKLAYTPTGSIYPRGKKAEIILRQLAEGAVITVRNRRALAIPVHGQRDGRGGLLPPSAFPGLVYIPSRKGDPRRVGVLALPAGRGKRGHLSARARRMQAAVSRARAQAAIGEDWIAMFILVRTVRLPKAFDPHVILREATARVPGLFERALATIRGGGAPA